jgi:imidazolonepropionase-like amidohydrolase
MDAIVAGTGNAADLLALADEVGTLEAGKRADIVIARGNPLQDITVLSDPENILAVVKDGRICKDTEGFVAGAPDAGGE